MRLIVLVLVSLLIAVEAKGGRGGGGGRTSGRGKTGGSSRGGGDGSGGSWLGGLFGGNKNKGKTNPNPAPYPKQQFENGGQPPSYSVNPPKGDQRPPPYNPAFGGGQGGVAPPPYPGAAQPGWNIPGGQPPPYSGAGRPGWNAPPPGYPGTHGGGFGAPGGGFGAPGGYPGGGYPAGGGYGAFPGGGYGGYPGGGYYGQKKSRFGGGFIPIPIPIPLGGFGGGYGGYGSSFGGYRHGDRNSGNGSKTDAAYNSTLPDLDPNRPRVRAPPDGEILGLQELDDESNLEQWALISTKPLKSNTLTKEDDD